MIWSEGKEEKRREGATTEGDVRLGVEIVWGRSKRKGRHGAEDCRAPGGRLSPRATRQVKSLVSLTATPQTRSIRIQNQPF